MIRTAPPAVPLQVCARCGEIRFADPCGCRGMVMPMGISPFWASRRGQVVLLGLSLLGAWGLLCLLPLGRVSAWLLP